MKHEDLFRAQGEGKNSSHQFYLFLFKLHYSGGQWSPRECYVDVCWTDVSGGKDEARMYLGLGWNVSGAPSCRHPSTHLSFYNHNNDNGCSFIDGESLCIVCSAYHDVFIYNKDNLKGYNIKSKEIIWKEQ